MRYLSIDLETTGLDPRRHNVIEFAAVLEDTAVEMEINSLPHFHCYVAPPEGGYYGSPVALGMHSQIFKTIGELLKRHISDFLLLNNEEVGPAFRKWLTSHQFDMSRGITCAGKNFAAFDMQFIKKWFVGFPKMHHRCLDPAMLFLQRDDVEIPCSDQCIERAGVSENVLKHTALSDARMVVQLLRAGLEPQWVFFEMAKNL